MVGTHLFIHLFECNWYWELILIQISLIFDETIINFWMLGNFMIIEIRRGSMLKWLVYMLRWVIDRHVAAAPTHLNALLKISFWNPKIFLWNIHLMVSWLRLTSAHTHLFQEMVEWCDQVFTEIEVIVIHSSWQDYTTWSITVIMQFLRMMVRYKIVLHSMNQKSWRCHIFHFVNISEPVLYQIFQDTPCLILCNSSNWLEGWHEQ